MEEAVSAADANRRFSLLLRGVREGHSHVVTSHGKPIARLVPAGRHDDVAARARTALLARLDTQPAMNAGRWTRAVILSAAARSVCRLLLSEDLQAGFTWAGVTVVDPFATPRHALLRALLGDDRA